MRVDARKSAWGLLVGAVVLHAGNLAGAPFLPFVDLPQHLAAAQLVLHRTEPAVASLFDFALVPAVNVLGLFVMVPLHAALPEAIALRLLFAVYLGALAWALARLSRAIGGSPWAAVLGFLFALNYNVLYGFVSFCLGIPILVLLVARWAQSLERPAVTRELAFEALLWWFAALAHVLVYGFAWLAFAVRLGFARRGTRSPHLLAAVPALAWVAGCGLRARAAVARTSPGETEVLWHGFRERTAELGRALGVASASGWVEWSGLVIVGILAVAALAAELSEARDRRIRFVRVVAAIGALLYVTLPFSVYDREHRSHGLFLLYARYLMFLPLLFLPTLRLRGRTLAVAAGLACTLHLTLAARWAVSLHRIGAQADGLDGAVAALAGQKRIKSLVYSPVPDGWRFEGFLHVASLHQARSLGETDQSFTLIPANPVRYRDPRRPYLSRQDEHLEPERFDWRRARAYDAALAYDPDDVARSTWSIAGRASYDHNGWRAVILPSDRGGGD